MSEPGQLGARESREASLATVYRYHDGTKHHFHAFARSLGYLDWASQPNPFREFVDTPVFPLYPAPGAPADGYELLESTFDQACERKSAPAPLSASAVGDMLRHALGLSAWKRLGASRWSLRVNPSSGNLHPTEAYVICRALPGLADRPAVYHYAADRHALELRCIFEEAVWSQAFGGRQDTVLVALTSIHWRESWKYGERAFRYCQHDLGHAIAAVSFAAAVIGWRALLLPAWSGGAIAAVTGIDRDEDFTEAEREEPGCIMAIGATTPELAPRELVDAIARGRWSGRASQLSEDHIEWSFIGEVASATGNPGLAGAPRFGASDLHRPARRPRAIDARALLLRRRSALAFDGRSTIDRAAFVDMLSSVLPGSRPPWDAVWWTPRVHLAIFVHRVDGLAPGMYLLVRDAPTFERLRAACGRDFRWDVADPALPLYCLARGDVRSLAARVSCDQEIAADGFFSLGMLADFDASLQTFGPAFYRHLYWETGIVGQALYLEAEAAGSRATGIGCFYDDPVHDVLGLRGHAFQSLYHFTVGMPVDDPRLMTGPAYPWEGRELRSLQTRGFMATFRMAEPHDGAVATGLTLDRPSIERSRDLIAPHIRTTPTVTVPGSDLGVRCRSVTFKLEQLQHAGAFKTRGAFVNLLSRPIPAAGVVAASGGNHGVAVAYAAMRLQIPATIFLPSISSPAKVARIREYGAELRVAGDRYADALAASKQWAAGTDALEIHAFDQIETLLGQATVGLELSVQSPDLDTILVAVGGGGLIGGIAAWYAGSRRIIGVEPELAPTLTAALEAGRPVDAPAGGIAADSLAPRRVGELMFPIARRHVDRVVLVSDDDIRRAQRTLWDALRLVAEPGGAAACAALLTGRYEPGPDERIGVIISGGNTAAVDFEVPA